MKFFKDVWSIRGIFYKFMKTQLIELCGFLTQEQNKSSQECMLTDHWCELWCAAADDDRQGLCSLYCILSYMLLHLSRNILLWFIWFEKRSGVLFRHLFLMSPPPEHQPPPTRTPTRTSSSATCSSEHMQMQLLYKHKKETSYLADNLHMLWYGLWWKRYRYTAEQSVAVGAAEWFDWKKQMAFFKAHKYF